MLSHVQNIGKFVILRYDRILYSMRETVCEKIQQNFIVKSQIFLAKKSAK
jgi:hypothetical protein